MQRRMSNRRSDRQSLVEREHTPDGSDTPYSTSTLKFEDSSSTQPHAASVTPQSQTAGAEGAAAAAEGELQQLQQGLDADDVQQARQLQLQQPLQPLHKGCSCAASFDLNSIAPVMGSTVVDVCHCSDGVVHAACAESERRYEDKRAEAERASSLNRAVEEQHECIICQSTSYRRREDRPGVILREDTRWIKPCFCEVYAHHGCLAGVVAARQTCPQCGERYSYRVYGSLLDFLARYWVSYCIIASIVAFFCLVAVYSMVHVATWTHDAWTAGRVCLLIVGLFLSTVALCCLGSCLRYTFGFRVPRFKSKYSFVKVSNYAPPSSRETTKRSKTTASLLLAQVPRKDSDKTGRGLLSFSLPSEDSMVVNSGQLPPHEFQYTSTPKIAGTTVPFDFTTPSFRGGAAPPLHSPKNYRRLEEHPLRLTLERVPEMPEDDSISYDETSSRA
ncbi:hypothetical protein PRIPAC_88467 [Pristionchus pacificus]|uniref:Uncharacterized protein n=1 Tax=Pristionchus pacificus TaxID=54126 RepID=A0A8R1YH52_PRIPA|nr:hypothetical protein PRIPAC_88467 [Pristionchus pacificus]|eukprot:PDM83042.1 hypothetical protein PRIPAC_37435 [Pristionchus pacificus]